MRKRYRSLLLSCFYAFCVGCGGDKATLEGDDSPQKDVVVLEIPDSVAVLDESSDVSIVEVSDFTPVLDEGLDDAVESDYGFPRDRTEIDFVDTSESDAEVILLECETEQECASFVCVLANDGKKYCAPFCPDGECPEGWECSEVTSAMFGDIKICLPKLTYLCRPCMDNEDCVPEGLITKLDCVALGNMGRFCLPRCYDCPVGYECTQGLQDHCAPKSGVCECIEEFIIGGYETICYVENDYGKCEGMTKCTADGLAPCSALTPTPEACNTIDDDCDGETDEMGSVGCVNFYKDEDADSFGTSDFRCLCNPSVPFIASKHGDCNDHDAQVNPDAKETCGNGSDDNCNGETDEDCGSCSIYYKDEDGDGYGITGDSQCLLVPIPPYTATRGGDCQDHDSRVNPAASELCNEKDDDCDGLADEDFLEKGHPCDGYDSDFCIEGIYVCRGDGTGVFCNDTTSDNMEVCNNLDDDCDGVVDNGGFSLCPPTSFTLCDGDVLTFYSGQGDCVAGICSYPVIWRELCAWGCASGACKPCQPSCNGVLCGDDGCGGSCGHCPDGAPLNPAHNQVLNILGRWWMPNFGDGDHMTTNNPNENPSGTYEGQMFYVPADNLSGTHALYRLLASYDHMDSTQAGEGGYNTEFILGYPFDSVGSGLCEIRRWFSRSQTDHMTAFCNEDPSAQGYQKEGVLGYGFPRHGNNCEVPIVVQGSEVTIVSNLAAGGAISELWWNGKQFINNYDYGRQIQIAFNQTLPGETDNPTEGGDKWGCPGVRPAGWAHGSIVLSYSVEQQKLTTLTSPLQWSPENFGGGRDKPVRWLGTIGKTVELDFAGMAHAIKWTTSITFPGGANFLDLEIVTAYLNSEFDKFYAYDAFAQELTDMTSIVPNGGCLDPSDDAHLRPVAGGVIISTSDGAYALGVYRRYGRNNFGLCKFLGTGGTGKYGFQTTKWNVLQRQPNGISPGTHSFTVYLVVGTLQDTVDTMRKLFVFGYR